MSESIEHTKHTFPARTSLLLIVLAFLAYISLGLPDAVPGVAWPAVRETYGLPISYLGQLLIVSMCGYLVASFASGWLVQRIGLGAVLVSSGTAIVIGMIGYALSPSWGVMVGMALFAGLGAGSIDAGLNVFAANRFKPRLMVWLHGCWGVGAVLGPLIMTASIANHGFGWRGGYGVLAGIIFVISLGFLFTLKQWDDGTSAKPQAAEQSVKAEFRHLRFAEVMRLPAAWLNALLFFFYTGLEVGVGAWVTSLLAEARGANEAQAGTAAAIYWASVTAGRFVIGGVANRVSSDLLLRIATIAAPVVLLLLWFPKSYGVNIGALVLLGFMVSPIFPLWTSITPRRVGADAVTHAIGLQIAAACLGMSLIPAGLGILARYAGLEIIPPALVLVAIAVLVLHEWAIRNERKSTKR